MKLVLSFFILLILILGTIFLKIRVFADNLELKIIKTDLQKTDYKVKVSLYFLGFIKIGSIKIEKGYVKFLFFRKKINDLKKSKIFITKIKPKINNMTKKQIIEEAQKINFRLDKLNFDLKFGTDSVLITSILIGVLSAIISSSMQIYIEKFNKKKYKWKIIPNFQEEIFIDLNASLRLSYLPIVSKIIKNE